MIWTLPLSFQRPPLTLNQRFHWAVKAQRTAEIVDEVILRCRAAKVPPMVRPTVTLHYAPPDARRRDVDNLMPTSKAAVDGLVRANVLFDDSPKYVDHRMPVIEAVEKPARLWLQIEAVTAP